MVDSKHHTTFDFIDKTVLAAQSCPTFGDSIDIARQAHLFMGFSRQENWSFPFPSPEDLPDAGSKPGSPTLQTDFFYYLSHKESPYILKSKFYYYQLNIGLNAIEVQRKGY